MRGAHAKGRAALGSATAAIAGVTTACVLGGASAVALALMSDDSPSAPARSGAGASASGAAAADGIDHRSEHPNAQADFAAGASTNEGT